MGNLHWLWFAQRAQSSDAGSRFVLGDHGVGNGGHLDHRQAAQSRGGPIARTPAYEGPGHRTAAFVTGAVGISVQASWARVLSLAALGALTCLFYTYLTYLLRLPQRLSMVRNLTFMTKSEAKKKGTAS